MTFTAGVGRLLVTSAAVSREVVEEDFGDKRKITEDGQCVGLCCGWGASLTPSSLLLSSETALSVVVVVVLLLTLPGWSFSCLASWLLTLLRLAGFGLSRDVLLSHLAASGAVFMVLCCRLSLLLSSPGLLRQSCGRLSRRLPSGFHCGGWAY